MVADTKLYDLLEVEPDATQKQISKAIKKKSLEHHPDRGGSHEMMQKINKAKEVLTDPKKRRIYDQNGSLDGPGNIDDTRHPFPGYPGSLFDLFNGMQTPRERQGSDIKHSLKVSLEELYSGTTRTVTIDHDVVCTECKGTGCKDGVQRECKDCEGTGIETLLARMGPIVQHIQHKCSSCNGSGHDINSKNRCKNCYGKQIFSQQKKLEVHIAHGSQHKESIKFIGDGNQIPNGKTGDAYIILEQEPHSIFNRKDDHLLMKMEINLNESLCGFQRTITLLDGHKIIINHPPGKPIKPNTYRRLKGQGMPNRHTHTNGDIIIHFDVQFPEDNFIQDEHQLKQLEALLPPKTRIKSNAKERLEQVNMMECESFEEDHHHYDEEIYDDPRVRCATQ